MEEWCMSSESVGNLRYKKHEQKHVDANERASV